MSPAEPRVAVVTGATSPIGRAIAIKLAERAARIGVHYYQRRLDAQAVVKEIKEKGKDAQAFRANLSSPPQAKKLIQMVERKWGRIDILVNNFGPFLHQPWEKTSSKDWLWLFNTNVLACFELIKAVIPGMKARKWGRIINLGFHRVGQMVAFPNILPYAAAKTSLLMLTRTVASSLIRDGITVNMVSPGLIQGGRMPEVDEEALSGINIGQAEDVAEAVNFLASEEAGAITGNNLIVAGTWKI